MAGAEDPAARRARLAALRADAAAAGEATTPGAFDDAAAADAGAEPPVLKFRNYHVADEAAVPGAVAVKAAKAPDLVMEPVAREVVPEGAPDEVVLAALAPKKPHADLARDLAPALAKLERRTQRAIVAVLRDQHASGGGGGGGGGQEGAA